MYRLTIVLSVLVLCSSCFLFSAISVSAELQIVVPRDLTNVDGNDFNAFPFSCFDDTSMIPSMRYQQVYAAQELSPGIITQISFRLDQRDMAAFGPAVEPNIQIDMSTTDAQPGALSFTFADNLGPEVQTVFFGDLTLQAPSCLADPCPFDINILLQDPYLYDPRDGNLLLDVRVNQCINIRGTPSAKLSGFFDASNQHPGSSSRVFTSTLGDVNSPEGQFANNNALVTQFTIVRPNNVPALSEWGLIAMAGLLALVGFIGIRRGNITA